MATGMYYQFDVGDSHPSSCFPVRQRKEGAGHWLLVHKNEMESKYRNLQTKKKKHHLRTKSNESGIKSTAESGTSDTPTHNTLNAHFLMRLHCVDKPSELCSIDISDQRLTETAVKSEDLKEFDTVVCINASVNSLSLGSFSNFCSLRELDLSLNGLCNMIFNAEDFPHLEVLDLSYNRLTASDIVSIGLLARLKILHLSGNKLHDLPPNLGCLNHDPTHPTKEEGATFRALEVLRLDDNKLSSGIFSSLAHLRRLRHLNLQKNYISAVPNLQPRGCLNLLQTCKEQKDKAHNSVHVSSNPEKLKRVVEESQEDYSEGSSPPLPKLEYLNLAHNKIAEEEALLAVAVFPVLKEIVIHSNPLTTWRSGGCPLLTYFLQERLAIKIKRKEKPEVVKPTIILSTYPRKKIKKNNAKLSKRPLLMEVPISSRFSEHQPLGEKQYKNKWENLKTRLSAQTQIEKNEETYRKTAINKTTEPLFVTQTTDFTDYQLSLQADDREITKSMENNEDNVISEKLKGYKMLLDTKPNPDVAEPTGIQPTVRILAYTLKNLLIYRDSKPKLDSFQKPYREKEKKIKNLPPLKSTQRQAEKVEEMLKEIKGSKTLKRIPLGHVLDGKGANQQEYEEALSLLEDMKKKYQLVLLKTAEQAARIESEINIHQK
ncbi:X-ray radiation resistance-associated protein 1 [Lampris incognitus]|uniref:X-ray radiation resistance-associated protein 1 n=1 Tax=Lampris incognitus TaxID=2546036 RepID=UPI0024B635E8|nr:X-ray radiation resistance-associated protein 1 [Lampris incognitus]